jgi:hypothetical protein
MTRDRVFFHTSFHTEATPSQTCWRSSVGNAVFLIAILACLIFMLFLGAVVVIAQYMLFLPSRVTSKLRSWRQ